MEVLIQFASRGERLGAFPLLTHLPVHPSWLGQNSKQGKLNRQLTDIQAKMRLKASADKLELRQSYLPAMFPHLVQPLMERGVVRRKSHLSVLLLFTVCIECGG